MGDSMNIIEEFYFGNIKPKELSSELTHKLKKKLSNLADKEEQFTERFDGESKEMFLAYVRDFKHQQF